MKLNLKQTKKLLQKEGRPKLTTDNILGMVESGELDMYVRRAEWKYKPISRAKYKDEISVYLNSQNIKGELQNIKIEIEQLPLVRESRHEDSFKILAPNHEMKNRTIQGRRISQEHEMQEKNLEHSINGKINSFLWILRSQYKEKFTNIFKSYSSLLEMENEIERLEKAGFNKDDIDKKIDQMLDMKIETSGYLSNLAIKTKIIDQLISDLEDNLKEKAKKSIMYEVIHFLTLPLPHEEFTKHKVKIGLIPTPSMISEPIQFDDIYFLEQDILKLKLGTTDKEKIKQLENKIKDLEATLTAQFNKNKILESKRPNNWRSAFDYQSDGLNDLYRLIETYFFDEHGNPIYDYKTVQKKDITDNFKSKWLSGRTLIEADSIITSGKRKGNNEK